MCESAVWAASARGRGFCGTYPSVPRLRTMPAAGSSSPASTLSRLVLPAPFRPTNPTLSPAATVKLASESTRRAATSMARFLTCSTVADVTCRDIQRLVCQFGNQLGGRRMKKVLVVIAILVAAAACGGAGSTVGSTAGAPTLSHGPAQNGSSGTPSKTGGQPGSTDVANPSNPSYSSTVPAI